MSGYRIRHEIYNLFKEAKFLSKMTKKIKVACATLNQTALDWEGNKKNILAAISEAKKEKVRLLLLPEMCITGYGCEDAFLGKHVSEQALRILLEIAPEAKNIAVSLGLPVFCGEEFAFNTACLLVDGKIAGFVAKQALPIHGIHYESRWFEPGKVHDRRELEVAGKKYPLGDLLFSFAGIKVGYEICRDAWVEERPIKRLAKNGVSLVLNPSASHFAFNRHASRKAMIADAVKTYGTDYMYVNLLGNEAGSVIYDGCAFIASAKKDLISGQRFSFKDYALTYAILELGEKVVETPHPNIIDVDFDLMADAGSGISRAVHLLGAIDAWEDSADLKVEEFVRAVSLGLFDYLRKSKLQGFVLSLSGGADSSTVACLVYLMLELAIKELGLVQFKSKLAAIAQIQNLGAKDEMRSALLFCLYQATRNSSQTTRSAAEIIAKSLGASFASIDVDPLVESYTQIAESVIERKLNWKDDAQALQNIQARVRAPGAWLIANLRNALLLATSNRSEASVGYATMDGDTAGGLSPIAGVDKTFILKFLSILETKGLSEIPAMPFLSCVTSQKPTAELRPQEEGQTDEAELMPYVVLNEIERLAVGRKLAPAAVLAEVRKIFSGYSEDQLRSWVKKFFRLFTRSQWKRERFAPSFFLDEHSLDPRTWHRFPVLSGGYEEELGEM